MPTLSMFYGIIVRMYFAPAEHHPPHIHVYYQDDKASINILNFELMNGNLPSKQSKMIIAWMAIHQDELMANWNLCQNNQRPFSIEPLK